MDGSPTCRPRGRPELPLLAAYLGLAALNQARLAQGAGPDLTAPLGKLYRGLEFGPGFDSPRGFQADEFRRELERLRPLLQK